MQSFQSNNCIPPCIVRLIRHHVRRTHTLVCRLCASELPVVTRPAEKYDNEVTSKTLRVYDVLIHRIAIWCDHKSANLRAGVALSVTVWASEFGRVQLDLSELRRTLPGTCQKRNWSRREMNLFLCYGRPKKNCIVSKCLNPVNHCGQLPGKKTIFR